MFLDEALAIARPGEAMMNLDRDAGESSTEDAPASCRLDKKPRPAMAAGFELRLLRRIGGLHTQFKDGHDSSKVPRAALRSGMELLAASDGCFAILPSGEDQAQVLFSVPRDNKWDRGFLTAFIRGQKLPIPADLALGRMRRRGRLDGVLVVRSNGSGFGWDAREAMSAIADAASQIVGWREDERIRDVRVRLESKLMEQLRPKDLFYQILHGLRSLTDYDHSAALLIYREETRTLELAAEQVAWQKRKSEKIGLRLPLTSELLGLLQSNVVQGFNRDGDSCALGVPATGWRNCWITTAATAPCRANPVCCARPWCCATGCLAS